MQTLQGMVHHGATRWGCSAVLVWRGRPPAPHTAVVAAQVVINYSFPLTTEDYVHRIGRTGRAGKTGERCAVGRRSWLAPHTQGRSASASTSPWHAMLPFKLQLPRRTGIAHTFFCPTMDKPRAGELINVLREAGQEVGAARLVACATVCHVCTPRRLRIAVAGHTRATAPALGAPWGAPCCRCPRRCSSLARP